MTLLEVCVEDLAGALVAEAGGAGRLELCSRLELGGLSPARAVLEQVLERVKIPVHVMVRPRAGGFVYDAEEHADMLAELAFLRTTRARGAVFGVLTADRRIDRARIAELVGAARPLSVTFHRAFDEVAEPLTELELLCELGVDRVLTSGGAPTALEGRETLRRLIQAARGRIQVLPGGGIRAHNANELLSATGASELHSSTVFQLAQL